MKKSEDEKILKVFRLPAVILGGFAILGSHLSTNAKVLFISIGILTIYQIEKFNKKMDEEEKQAKEETEYKPENQKTYWWEK